MPDVIRAYRGASFFATRAAARQLCTEIDALPPGEPVTVDWSGIDAVTGAFADEYVKWQLGSTRQVTDQGMNASVRDSYELARQRNGEEVPGA